MSQVSADPKDRSQEHLAGIRDRLPAGVYRHYKGGEYVLFAHSLSENTLLPLIHYYSLSKRTRWTRDVGNWLAAVDGRPRFSFQRTATREEMLAACGIE